MTQFFLPNIEKNRPIFVQMGRSVFEHQLQHQIKNHTRNFSFPAKYRRFLSAFGKSFCFIHPDFLPDNLNTNFTEKKAGIFNLFNFIFHNFYTFRINTATSQLYISEITYCNSVKIQQSKYISLSFRLILCFYLVIGQ